MEALTLLPAPLLALLLYVFIKREGARQHEDRDELKKAQATALAAIIELDKKFIGAATVVQLGSMGDRFDERVRGQSERTAVLESQMRALEAEVRELRQRGRA